MRTTILIIAFLFLSHMGISQGLFDSAGDSEETALSANGLNFDMGGYVRGVTYLGKLPEGSRKQGVKSAYGETSLKLNLGKDGLGDFYSWHEQYYFSSRRLRLCRYQCRDFF